MDDILFSGLRGASKSQTQPPIHSARREGRLELDRRSHCAASEAAIPSYKTNPMRKDFAKA
jgi:hypothetical protein